MGTDGLRAVAYLNHGRWVAMCPRPGCHNAEQFGGVGQAGNVPGGLRSDRFECRASIDFGAGPVPAGGCGVVCGVDWPANIAEIEALVMPRPVPATRNWHPGEDLHDLLAENLMHGIVPTAALEGRGGLLLSIVGDEITVGALESAPRPPAIERT